MMGNYEQLKTAIAAIIRDNGQEEITGDILQGVLLGIIDSVGSGATFAGVATPSTNPGTPDPNVFYIAGQAGTYTNFNLTITDGLWVFENKNGTWVGTSLDVSVLFATGEDVSQTNIASSIAGAGSGYLPTFGVVQEMLNGVIGTVNRSALDSATTAGLYRVMASSAVVGYLFVTVSQSTRYRVQFLTSDITAFTDGGTESDYKGHILTRSYNDSDSTAAVCPLHTWSAWDEYGGGKFASGEKVADVSIAQTLGNSQTSVASQKAVTDAIYNTIDIANIDGMKNDATLRTGGTLARYTATTTLQGVTYKVGILDVMSDSAGHVLTQILTTHYTITSGVLDTSSHSDGAVRQYYRSVKINGGTLPTTDWTLWKPINDEQLDVLSAAMDAIKASVGYYVCDTAAGTAAKLVSATGYELATGGCIRIKMMNGNTANNVTLNINSTGAKALYYDGAQASSTNTWEAGEVLEVYYDGTQYQCASGGGGKFATGEAVKDVAITQEIVAGSSALPTSAAVAAVTTEAVDVHPPVLSYERVGLNVDYFVSSTTRVSLKLPMPIDKVKLTSFASGYRASVVQWNANNPSASLLEMRGTKLSDSGWLSTDTTVNILQSANFVNVTVSKTNNGTITIDEAVAAVVITYAGIRPNNYFSTGEKVSETGITDIITENSTELLKAGAVYPIKQAVVEYREILDNCYHNSSSPSGTETKTITSNDLMNGTQYWSTDSKRVVMKIDSLIGVEFRSQVNLYIPYSAVSSDSHIDRATIPLYDANKNYMSTLDLGWFYFNGQDLTITLSLNDSRYADVRYIGIYFGSGGSNISPSSINTAGILYTITIPSQYTTKAVDEEMLQVVQEQVDSYQEALNNCFRTIDVYDSSVGIQQSELGNLKNNDFSAANNRINLKQDALIPVSGKSKVVLTIPYSAVSSDSNIIETTMPMYDRNKTYLIALNLGWYYFNGNDVIIEYDLEAHPEVAYVSVYFGSQSASISPSSINVSGIKFDLYTPQDIISPAVSEVQIQDAREMNWNVPLQSSVYYGEKVSLTEYGTGMAINKFAYETIGTLAGQTGQRQGGAIYSNYLLQFHLSMASVVFFDLATKTNVQTITLTPISNFHAGSGGFSRTFYDVSDPFPLLYVAGMEQKIINVYRITGTAGNFVMTKIQTISLTIPYYLPNIAIDNEHGRIVVFSYTKNSWSDSVNNDSMFFTFPIPAHDQDVTITQMDNLHKRPFIYAQQGAFAIGNILYLSYGVPSTDTGIIVYDYYNDIVKNLIGTNVIASSFEPEALGVYNGTMIVTRNTGEVYQLSF